MPTVREVATLNTKGQVTLPESVRKALDVDVGGKLAFELRGNEAVITRADDGYEDLLIRTFLAILADDIKAGRDLQGLSEDFVRTLLEYDGPDINPDHEIDEEWRSEAASRYRLGKLFMDDFIRRYTALCLKKR